MSFSATINWGDYWEATDREDLDEMQAAGERMADRLDRLFDTFPTTLADVGCGPAFLLFTLSPRYPNATLVGYDAAESVVQQNRSLATAQHLDNLTFETATLPAFDIDRTFQCVTCIATLHYVADIETAIESLYSHVEPGGTLIFNYPNRYTRAADQKDPETDPDRFELVLEGENLLTYQKIQEILPRKPRSFWKAVNVDNWRSLGQTNPCVIIEK
ncbi:MAG: trans-aconitate 2-methyltransferase [Halobacteriaceae archaeon]